MIKNTFVIEMIERVDFYDANRGFGFIRGVINNQKIFFHITTIKKSNPNNIEEVIRNLERKLKPLLPYVWCLIDQNNKGLYVKNFLANDVFYSKFFEMFIRQYAGKLRSRIADGVVFDRSMEHDLKNIFKEDYDKLLIERFNETNSYTEWNLNFIKSNGSNYKNNIVAFDALFNIIDIPYVLQNKAAEILGKNEITPVFIKKGVDFFGEKVVSEVRSYLGFSETNNSDVAGVKYFIKNQVMDNVDKYLSIFQKCGNCLFTPQEIIEINDSKLNNIRGSKSDTEIVINRKKCLIRAEECKHEVKQNNKIIILKKSNCEQSEIQNDKKFEESEYRQSYNLDFEKKIYRKFL